MNHNPPTNPKQICESILNEDRRNNLEKGILRSEVTVIDRLLTRGVELTAVYAELHSKLYRHPFALNDFLGIVLSAAAFWNPEKMAEARVARQSLSEVNQKIARKAVELADLLVQREDLHETSGFRSDTHYHVAEILSAAGQHNHLFASYVQENLDALRRQYDLKYWPTPVEFLEELAANAAAAESEASDPLTAAGTEGKRSSSADFVYALYAGMEENSARNYGRLPRDFKLSDGSVASLMNCALNLNVDDMVDGLYIKRLRQRERERKSASSVSALL